MISPELRLVASSISNTTNQSLDDGTFTQIAVDLIKLQFTLVHFAQRDILANYLWEVEPDWPWAKQPTRQ